MRCDGLREWISAELDGEAGPAVVDSLPSPFPVPQIERPVRPHASTVHIHGIVPGARVHLLVNNRVRVSLDSPSRELFISPGFPPLADRDGLWAVQTLCDKRSSLEGVQVPVEKGRLKVNVSPSPVERGKSTLVTVTAQDADTGAAVVGATVSLNGSAVGVTGTAFAFAPALGQPNPSGVVSSPVAYIDEPFTITLKDPPPKEPAKLFLNVGPSTLVIGALQLSSAKWMVQTGWGSPTINATGINTVVPVPDPPAGTPAANKIVRITLACEAKANGWINGYAYSGTFTCHNRPGSPDPVGVAWDGKNWSVSWLALFDQFLDGNGVPTIIVTVGWTATVAA